MKTGRTLQELAVELHRQAKSKRDFVVHSKSFIAGAMPERISINRYDSNGRFVEMESFGTTNLFHRQLGDALGIPSRYYDKMKDELPDLLAENVFQWLRNGNKRYMLRTLDGQARAFLSDRYRRIDHLQIAQAVLPVIGQMPDARVESCEVTPNKLYLKVVNPRLQAVRRAAFSAENAKVRYAHGAPYGGTKFPRRPPPASGGVKPQNGLSSMASRGFKPPRRAGGVEGGLARPRGAQRATRALAISAEIAVRLWLRESVGVKIYGDVPSVVELAAKEYGFSQTEQSGVLRHLIEGHDLTLYGLSNAVTRASQELDSYDRATALETAGWQMVTMTPQLWRALNGVRA